MLFDANTLRLTAFLDFDWTHVSSLADEFFPSFVTSYDKMPGPYGDASQLALRNALLHRFPDPLPASQEDLNWEVARAWDAELEKVGAQRPSTIKGTAQLSGVYWLSEQICPFLLCNPTVVVQRSKEQIASDRKETEELLIQFLERS